MKIFVWCILTTLLTCVVSTYGQTRRELNMIDINPADIEKLKTELPALFEARPSIGTMDHAIRILMADGKYENVTLEQTESGQFHLVGRPLRMVDEIKINGNKNISQDDILDLIEVKPGDRFERKKAVQAAEKVKNFYGESGFYNAIVELSFIKNEKNGINLVFDIKELGATRLKGIELETENTILKKRLLDKFKSRIGKPLTTSQMQSIMDTIANYLIDYRYLVAEVVGPNVRYNPDKSEAYIQIEIREAYRWEFFFAGYNYETLTGLYRALDLANRERKNLEPASEGAERLKRHYLALGFPNIRIETQVNTVAPKWLKRVTYNIYEGPRVKIGKLEIQGRISRPPKYYESFIFANSSDLISRGYYNRVDLDNGFKNLVTELRNQGYLRARVQSSRVEYNKRKDKVIVYVLMDEGPLTQIRAIDFEGNRFFSSYELTSVMQLDTNTPLRLNTLETSIENLKSFYRRQGFLEMRLLNEGDDLVQYNDKGTQARLLFKIFEGPRIRVNSIRVEGNTFTKTKVILQEADFRVGEILTPEKLEEASSRLNRLGIFSRADIHTLEENTSVSERTLIISVTERDPGNFRFGAGVNDERRLTARGFVGMAYNNLWGTGRAVSGRVEIKNNISEVRYTENEITVGYLEPFLFNTRTRGRVNLTRSDRVFDYTSENQVTSITRSNKFDFLLERDLSKHTRVTWKVLSLDLVRAFELKGRCVDPATNTILAGPACPTNQQVATIGPTIDFDFRDNPFLPTSGALDRLSLDYSSPSFGSTKGIHFLKVENTFTKYTRLGSPRFIWANSLRGGYITNLSNDPDSGIPASQAFFLGGLFTIRGFDTSSDKERIPPGYQLPFNRSTDLIIRKESHYGLFKSELRFGISGEHGGVVFYDGGYVMVSGYKGEIFDRPYRDSVGFGYRYNTPVGPVALDFAFKIRPRLDKDKEESLFRFHFSIGTF